MSTDLSSIAEAVRPPSLREGMGEEAVARTMRAMKREWEDVHAHWVIHLAYGQRPAR